MAEMRPPSEHPHAEPPLAAHPSASEGFDRELAIRKIVDVGLATAGISLAAFLVIVVLYRGLAKQEAALDPAPSPIPEANAPPVRPEPHLQETPELDLAALRRAQQAELEGYAWVDRGAGLARIPIERALELTLERGLAPLPATAVTGDASAAPVAAPSAGVDLKAPASAGAGAKPPETP